MDHKQLMSEMIQMTGEWSVPEFVKILGAEMTGMATHEFHVLFYKPGEGETELKITLKEIINER